FATGLALFHRCRSGEGQHVATSLSQSSTLHQAAYLLAFDGERTAEPSGLDATGWHALQRLYRARDGWFFLAAGPGQHARLADVEGLDDVAANDGALAEAFATAPLIEWLPRLRAAGIAAHPVTSLDDAAALLA